MARFGDPSTTTDDKQRIEQDVFKYPQGTYYDQMIGNSNKDFSDVVSAGEMIKAEVKQGKMEASDAKRQIPKRKEGETHVVTYQRKVYNLSYPLQQKDGYQSYN